MKTRKQGKIRCCGKIKTKFLFLATIFAGANLVPMMPVKAEGCPDVRIVFARGSGGERWVDPNYIEFRSTIEDKLKTTNLSYEFIDLDYPAVGVGVENLGVTLGAFLGGGEAYTFGKSISAGVENLAKMINNGICRDTKYVVGGYSQGAMVVSKSLSRLNPEKIIYAATFGDPKIYLPEGFGPIPPACSGIGLSEYRVYVPDCRVYTGLLGAYVPYQPEGFSGKVGTWCNKLDVFCSTWISFSDHTSYVSDGLYNDASKVIFDKITKAFGVENKVSSPHDTVIMLDSTGSMAGMIEKYKAEAMRLASETLRKGGRVALYDYRDLSDPYAPVEHCNFETCTLETFTTAIDSIVADGGGDTEESLLSAAFLTMKSLKWRFGATKSAVVLTDAPFLMPDRDGVTLEEVIRLSKEIDPVNFYIITNEESAESYAELATRTDGKVVTNFDELSLLTDYIMDRFDSLPRVEETDFAVELPTMKVVSSEQVSDSAWRVSFETDAEKVAVALNDWVLGVTDERTIVVDDLDFGAENVLTLVPIIGDMRGESVSILVSGESRGAGGIHAPRFLPKAPNTGRR